MRRRNCTATKSKSCFITFLNEKERMSSLTCWQLLFCTREINTVYLIHAKVKVEIFILLNGIAKICSGLSGSWIWILFSLICWHRKVFKNWLDKYLTLLEVTSDMHLTMPPPCGCGSAADHNSVHCHETEIGNHVTGNVIASFEGCRLKSMKERPGPLLIAQKLSVTTIT